MGWATEMGYDACDEDDLVSQKTKSCNRCGAPDLAFEKVDGRWRLVDLNGKPHRCDPVKAAQSDFSEV